MPSPYRPLPLLFAIALLTPALPSGIASAAPPATHVHPHGPAHGHLLRHHAGGRAALMPSGRASRSGTSKPRIEKPESVGSPNEGHLEGGEHLDVKKPYFRVIPAYETGDVRWGLPALIHLIDRAAKTVHKHYPGSVLDVGDLSRKGGGDVLRHHSHESGRDADIGFYAVDAKGKQVHGKGFVKFEEGLVSSNVPGARFDMARNWLLVQELLSDPAARVSHIFVAAKLRHELLTYARAHGASHAVLTKAAITMMQPTESLPHDDHFHVRISCPPSMHASCVEYPKGALEEKEQRLAAEANAHHRHLAAGIVTPGKSGHAAPGTSRRHEHAVASAHRSAKAGHEEELGHVRAPAASSAAPQDLFALPAVDGDSDAADVHDVVDESGTIRITD